MPSGQQGGRGGGVYNFSLDALNDSLGNGPFDMYPFLGTHLSLSLYLYLSPCQTLLC